MRPAGIQQNGKKGGRPLDKATISKKNGDVSSLIQRRFLAVKETVNAVSLLIAITIYPL